MAINWCERAEKLREIEFARLTGEGIEETRFGEDFVRFTKVSADELAAAIRYAERMCAQTQGRRTRFAMSARARPY